MRVSPVHDPPPSTDFQTGIQCEKHLKKPPLPAKGFSQLSAKRPQQQNGNINSSMQSPPPTIEVTKSSDGNSRKCRNGKSQHSRSKSAQTHAESVNSSRQQWHSNNYSMDVLQLQMDGPLTGRPMNYDAAQPKHSPSMKSNITVPKRRYSVWRKDSLIDMDTPEFTDLERRLRKSVPSSTQTVLALSGLFVCGLLLVLSGTIVLFTQSVLLFRLAGLSLLLLGLLLLILCTVLQRKNIGKWFMDMTRDLFALKEAEETTVEIGGLGQVPISFIRQ